MIFATWSLFAWGLTPQEDKKGRDLWQRVFQPGKRMNRAFWNNLTPTQQMLVLDTMRAELATEKAHADNQDSLSGTGLVAFDLAALGDDAGLRLVADGYHVQPWAKSPEIQLLDDPKTIALIGDVLFRGDELASGELRIPAGQEVARRDILYVLVNSHAFNEAVESWARRVGLEKAFDPSGTKSMRAWFRANEAKLATDDFGAVVPGLEPPDLSGSQAPPAATSENGSSISEGRPKQLPALAVWITLQMGDVPAKVLICVVAAILISCAVLISWRRKRR